MNLVQSRKSYTFCTSRNTWNGGLWHIPASCCTRSASRVAVTAPNSWLNPCRSSCTVMADQRRLFMMEVKNFNITSTNPIPLTPPPPPFGSIVIFVQVITYRMRPYWNTIWIRLTRVSHRLTIGSFSCI